MDNTENTSLIAFKSYKSSRVARSVLSAEFIAFVYMFDEALAIRHQIQEMLEQKIALQLLTDSSLSDVISKGSRTSERRLMIDIAAFRQGYKDRLIGSIGFVRSEHNLPDGPIKQSKQAALAKLSETARHRLIVEQWMTRSRINEACVRDN